MTKERTSKNCSKCLKNKNIVNDYYLASSDIISVDGRLSICKICLASIVDMDKVETLINAMRAVNRPFLIKTYNDSFSKKNVFGEYMRMLATPQNRDKTFLESDFNNELSNHSNKREIEDFNNKADSDENGYTEEGLATLRKRWGEFDSNDYDFLEEYYNEYAKNYSTDMPVQKMIYRNIAKVQLHAEKEISTGNIKSYKELMDLSSKLHNDGNIKPIQNTGANDDKGLSTYGLWIREIEKEEPCEYFEDKKMYEDYDSFNKYWEKWFIRPFKNIFNVDNDFDVEDEDGDDMDVKQ